VSLERALELAERGRGTTHPNPIVGAVVVRDGVVVGEGWHERKGGPHAEVNALAAAGERARGAFSEADAEAVLRRACANDVARAVGSVVYTQLLNARGGIECDLTVTRLAEDRFRLVTGTAFGRHDAAWVARHGAGSRVEVVDVTGAYACLGLWGPRARDVLAATADADVSNDAFPFLSAREIVVGDVPCLAMRVTYVGELGWELYPSPEYAVALWDALMRAGEPFGIAPAGYRAIDALRLEKGYRARGSDVSPDDSPLEAGLGFAVRRPTEGFLGSEALEQQRMAGVIRRLVCLTLDDVHAVAHGNEPVRHDGSRVGRVTSGGVGYAAGCSIAYAYVPVSLAEPGTRVSVRFFEPDVGAQVVRGPLWDPAGERVRA
jgi:4-methylaminobutanoate oxidase (formaldehyde-forming)